MAGRSAVVAVNTLSVTEANEGTKTMLRCLLPALSRVGPELRQVLICSAANRHLFDQSNEVVEVHVREDQKIRRIFCDQVNVPRLAKRRADVLLSPTGVSPLRTAVPQVVIVSAHLALPSCRRAAGSEGYHGLHRIYYGLPFRYSLHRADAVLGISQFVADKLIAELGVSPEKVSTMPLGVLMPDDAPPIANREPLILSVGTLYGYKDTMVTLRAFGRARSRLPDGARLVIAGKDFRGQIEVLRRATVEMGIESVVEIRGPVTSGELEDLYRRASMLIMPSRCEGFGLPVAEAMSRNTPVVVANATSLPEVAGAAGLVIETGDIASFANAMIEVLGDSALRSAMSKRGRIRAQELNWEASAQVLYQSIQKVLPS